MVVFPACTLTNPAAVTYISYKGQGSICQSRSKHTCSYWLKLCQLYFPHSSLELGKRNKKRCKVTHWFFPLCFSTSLLWIISTSYLSLLVDAMGFSALLKLTLALLLVSLSWPWLPVLFFPVCWHFWKEKKRNQSWTTGCGGGGGITSFCCLTSTEVRRPIRDGDEWENGDRRPRPQNRCQLEYQGCRGPLSEQQNVKAGGIFNDSPSRIQSPNQCLHQKNSSTVFCICRIIMCHHPKNVHVAFNNNYTKFLYTMC